MRKIVNAVSKLSCIALVLMIGLVIVSAASDRVFYFNVSLDHPAQKTDSINYDSTAIGVTSHASYIQAANLPLKINNTLFKDGWLWDTNLATASVVLENTNQYNVGGFGNVGKNDKHYVSTVATYNAGTIDLRVYSMS